VSKFHLPILFISLHLTVIFPSLKFLIFMVILHIFLKKFSTPQQIAQSFPSSIIFCDFLPYYGLFFIFSHADTAGIENISFNAKKLEPRFVICIDNPSFDII